MALRALFLDVGNTLLYEQPSRFELYAQAARRHGRDIATEEMAAHMRQAHAELPRWVQGSFRYTDPWFEVYVERIFHHTLGLPRKDLVRLSSDLFARFCDPATFQLHEGALDLLELARERQLRIGIISNWSGRLPRLLDQLDLTRRVDFVLCSALERLEKPSAEIYIRALERAGVQAEEALHAGDDVEKDILGAQRLGIRAVLVDHAQRHGAIAPRVHNLKELSAIVERMTA
jgi:putative hydrolase of the HAD superfamily